MRANLTTDFFNNVNKTKTCWIWTKSLSTSGYGMWSMRNVRTRAAHRISWIIHFGPIPEGIYVLHRCDNPPCVNPEHLFLGTQIDNVKDMIFKGRNKKAPGIRNRHAKLTDENVKEIRKLYYPKYGRATELAKQFNVDMCTILDITTNRTWKHIL